MIFAKLDVDIADHPKALAAGPAAFGLWAWGLAYSRKHELDGFLPGAAIRIALGAGAENGELAARLVDVGLWEPAIGGCRICHYADKNETKDVIAARRERERKKKEDWRRKSSAPPPAPSCPAPALPIPVSTGDGPVRPGSDSDSGSDLIFGSDLPAEKISEACPCPSQAVDAQAEPVAVPVEEHAPAASEVRIRIVPPVPSNAPDAVPAAPARVGTFGMAATSWADGVRSVTGCAPHVPPWHAAKLEEYALSRPDVAEDACAFMFGEGAGFARAADAADVWKVDAATYIAWASGGRKPMRHRPPARASPHRGRPVQPPGPFMGDIVSWDPDQPGDCHEPTRRTYSADGTG